MRGRTVLLAFVFFCFSFLSAQEPEQKPIEAVPETAKMRRKALLEGTHVFRRILFDSQMTPLNSLAELVAEPKRSILVVLGNLEDLKNVPGGLEEFVRAGGAVLLASDRMVADPESRAAMVAASGVSINQEKLISQSLGSCYQEVGYCPLVVSVPLARPTVFADIDVYCNVPSMLRIRRPLPGSVNKLAVLAGQCAIEMRRGLTIPVEGSPLLAVGGDIGEGRVMVLADHSIFINEMMLPNDTGNVELTYGIVRWLAGEEKERDRVLFLEEGQVQTKFEIPLKSAALSPEETLKMLFAARNVLLQKAEEKLTELEDEKTSERHNANFFNRHTWNFLDRLGLLSNHAFFVAVMIASLILMFFLIWRLGIRDRFAHDMSTPPLLMAAAKAQPVGPLIEQRTQTLIRRGSLLEPAELVVLRWFQGLGYEPGSQSQPKIVARGSWWQRRRIVARLRQLWRMARREATQTVGRSAFGRLQAELGDWGRAKEAGIWVIEIEGKQ
jgi:hypothetical protein